MKDFFLETITKLREEGKTEKEIARYFRMSTISFRKLKAKHLRKKLEE